MTISIENVWALLQQHQQETFYTAKGLPFTYTIRGGELFVDRRQKSITISTVEKRWKKLAGCRRTVLPSRAQRKSAAMGQAISIRCCWHWEFSVFPRRRKQASSTFKTQHIALNLYKNGHIREK